MRLYVYHNYCVRVRVLITRQIMKSIEQKTIRITSVITENITKDNG